MSVRSLLRLTSKLTASVVLLTIFAGASAPRQNAPQTALAPAANGNHVTVTQSDYYPVVHLRKLHLVRPDLIPYPIYYAVYC